MSGFGRAAAAPRFMAAQPVLAETLGAKQPKVFWFFFSKKNTFFSVTALPRQ